MALKVGNRVTVLPGVSNRKDLGSIQDAGPDGISRAHLVGKRGEVVQLGPRDSGMVLVNDQIHDGQPRGIITMIEWFHESEVELG